jgi:segregation and condensation protein B
MQDLEEQTHDAADNPESAPELGQDARTTVADPAQSAEQRSFSEATAGEVEEQRSVLDDEHESMPQADDSSLASEGEQPEQEDGGAVPESIATPDAFDEDASDEDEIYVAEPVAHGEPNEEARDTLKAIIEAAIYITDEPLTVDQIAGAIQQPVSVVKDVLAQLVREYAQGDRGLTVRELAGGYKMGTKPEIHESIRAFVKRLQPPLKLSLAALETLAVVAYKQPITAPEIMEIRGVQGAGVLKTLLDRKLIATAGRKDVIGKPIMYKTTKEFLIQFGLSSLNELPTLKEFEELGRLALTDESPQEPEGPSAPEQARASDAEDARTQEMGAGEAVSFTTERLNPAAELQGNEGEDPSQEQREDDTDPVMGESSAFENSVDSGKASDA